MGATGGWSRSAGGGTLHVRAVSAGVSDVGATSGTAGVSGAAASSTAAGGLDVSELIVGSTAGGKATARAGAAAASGALATATGCSGIMAGSVSASPADSSDDALGGGGRSTTTFGVACSDTTLGTSSAGLLGKLSTTTAGSACGVIGSGTLSADLTGMEPGRSNLRSAMSRRQVMTPRGSAEQASTIGMPMTPRATARVTPAAPRAMSKLRRSSVRLSGASGECGQPAPYPSGVSGCL